MMRCLVDLEGKCSLILIDGATSTSLSKAILVLDGDHPVLALTLDG